MKSICVLILSFIISYSANAQETYILQSKKTKIPSTAIAVTPDGKYIVAGYENGDFQVLRTENLEEKFKIEKEQKKVLDIEVSPKGDRIYVAAGTKTNIYDLEGEHMGTWAGHMTPIWSMELSNDGTMMVSGCISSTFNLRDVNSEKLIAQLRGHDKPAMAVAFSPDNKLIVSGGSDKMVHLWDIETEKVIADLHGHSNHIYDVAFSPDGKLVASCSYDKSIRIWEVEDLSLVHLLKGHRDAVMEIEFSPDGKYLLSASADFAIKLWDLASGEDIYAYLENESIVTDIAFLPDGKSFVSSGMDNHIKVWELNPEIFVLKYFGDEYQKELDENPVFLPKQKGEKKDVYQSRMEKAASEKKLIIDKYYQKYLADK